ncbi:endonuclease domain-containing protein [Streptomyces tanashiensis]|uniref:endonuclease domain-containing protein n=1 Tax=Streptomyces tanashiensis TaxID=67367 RepID=UPI00341DC64A
MPAAAGQTSGAGVSGGWKAGLVITPQLAAAFLADETRHCPIPMAPVGFRYKYNRDAKHDFVFFGHQPVRAYKTSNRWKFVESEVRAAGRAVAALAWDPHDLVDPCPGSAGRQGGSRLEPTGWRARIRGWIDRAARTAHEETGCSCGAVWGYGHEKSWGLRCGLTADALREQCGEYAIACVLPIASLAWTEDTWLIPRTLAFILDRQEETDENLGHTPRPCKVCGTDVTDHGRRAAAGSGRDVLCPACAQATLLSYRQQLDGKPYAKVRENGPPAQGYLCTLCDPPRPAAVWDHCHDHGLIRGPLCAGCNTMEGHGKDFLTLQGSTAHLLRCALCRTRRTLPTNHRLAALRRHLHRERGTPGCDWPLHMCVTLIDAGSSGFDCTVRCPGEQRSRSVAFHLTPEEADRIQARAVEEGLADPS